MKNLLLIVTFLMGTILIMSSCKKDEVACTETAWYQDADGDGLGNATVSQLACEQPEGYVSNNTDDDDVCAGVVDACGMCDGPGEPTWYQDADGDGLGNPDVSLTVCEQPEGYVADNTDTNDGGSLTNGADVSFFMAANANTTITTVACTLSDGTVTECYQIVASSTITDHRMGPWCPDNISDDASAGGIWLEGGEVYDVDGAFIQNLATFYNDNTWMMYDATGNISVTETEDDCINAANPNVGEAYQNFCVECLPAYITDLTQTWLIPVTPVMQETPEFYATGPGGMSNIPSTRGIALNGIEFSAPAPVDNILSAYTIAPFDDAGGHINVNQGYHYHAATGESFSVEQSDGHAPLIGYALDGHGIYSQTDASGNEPNDLDDCRGHADDIRGYHYHVDAAGANNFINCLAGAYVPGEDTGGGGPPTDGGGPGGGGPPTDGGGGPPGGGDTTGEIINSGSVDITSVVQANYVNTFTEGVTVQVNENSITISSTGLPDHKTPYWGEGHEMYEPFPDGNRANANMTMISYNYAMTIPKLPGEASEKEQTALGAVGMALNGVPLYNDFEGGGVLQENAWSTFDAAGAHPGPNEDYHYHCEGTYLTVDDANLIGFLRDGFPVYGRKEMDGTYPTDLDENGGHVGMTPDFAESIYHYHVSNEVYSTSGLYVIKSGAYHGAKGTFAQ